MNTNLLFKAPFNLGSGYGKLLDIFLREFPRKGFDIYGLSLHGSIDDKYKSFIKPIKKEIFDTSNEFIILPVSIEYYNRGVLLKLTSPRPRTVFTMWESTRISSFLAKEFNEVNSIIVPSQWNKENFINDGVSTPIHVVPLGIDTSIYKYSPNKNNDVFIFGTGNNDYRKRLKDVIRCFCRAFHPKIKDVRLKVKILPKDNVGTYLDNRIEILNKPLSQIDLASWYHGLDIFVSGAYAEGWGLMQHEAMACGRPIISPCYGGVKEFFDDSVGYCVDYEEVLADGPYENSGGFWANFNEDDMIEKMRWCYNNREDVKNKGILSSERVKSFTEENMVNSVIDIIKGSNTITDSFMADYNTFYMEDFVNTVNKHESIAL